MTAVLSNTITLTGNEVIYVLPVQSNGRLAAETAQTTTSAIAGLAAGGSTATVITALNTVGNGTVTAAGIYGKITQRGGTQVANFTDTTDTAANIIAALPASAVVGTAFKYTYQNNTAFNATLTGGTGVTITGSAIIPSMSWVEYLVTYSGAGAVTFVSYEAGQNSALSNSQFVTNTTTTTFLAGQLTGSDYNIYANTTATPGSIATRTAAQMFADIPNAQVGQSWITRIYNGGTGTLTVTAGTGVTITGTATIATVTYRDFFMTFTSATAVTMQNIGSGTA